MVKQPRKKTELKIMSLLAEHKEYAQYDMPKVLGKHYRTVLRHLQTLEKGGYIKLARTEPAKKGGKDRKIYTLTFKGLINCFANPENWSKLEKIIENYPDMLLTFKKWDLFKKAGLREYVLVRVQRAINALAFQDSMLRSAGHRFSWQKEDDVKKTIDSMVLWVSLFAERNETLAKICKEDPDLKQFIDSEFALNEQEIRERQEAKAWWSSLHV